MTAELTSDTETCPAMEVHLGEVTGSPRGRHRRCIIWINGKRWEGDLTERRPGGGTP